MIRIGQNAGTVYNNVQKINQVTAIGEVSYILFIVVMTLREY